MKEILAALALTIQELKTKANAALSGMAPLDQYAGASEVTYAINTLGWVQKEVETMLKGVADVAAKYDPEVQAAAEKLLEGKIAEMVAAGELARKTDMELALAAAEDKGKKEAEAALKLKEQAAATVAARRQEIVAAHGQEVADLVPDVILEGDAYAAASVELTRRVNELSKGGITAAAKKEAFAEIACGIPFDEEGIKTFDNRIVSLKQLLGDAFKPATAAATRPAPKVVPGSRTPAAVAAAKAPGATEEEEKPLYAF